MERELHLFGGSALNAVDAKGRLSVPAFIRQKIERRSDAKVLVLAPHPDLDCLIGYDVNWPAKLMERAEKRLGDAPERMAEIGMQAAAFASIIEVPYDASGRIILPPKLKRRAGIGDQALFMGTGFEFCIWNPDKALACEVPEVRDAARLELEDEEAA